MQNRPPFCQYANPNWAAVFDPFTWEARNFFSRNKMTGEFARSVGRFNRLIRDQRQDEYFLIRENLGACVPKAGKDKR